jgi:hypothetical protein
LVFIPKGHIKKHESANYPSRDGPEPPSSIVFFAFRDVFVIVGDCLQGERDSHEVSAIRKVEWLSALPSWSSTDPTGQRFRKHNAVILGSVRGCWGTQSFLRVMFQIALSRHVPLLRKSWNPWLIAERFCVTLGKSLFTPNKALSESTFRQKSTCPRGSYPGKVGRSQSDPIALQTADQSGNGSVEISAGPRRARSSTRATAWRT